MPVKTVLNGKVLGIVSIVLGCVSVAVVYSFNYFMLTAPVGIVCGIVAIQRGHKALGIVGICINALLLVGALVFTLHILNEYN